MNDKMQEIRDALYLAERNPQKHHEWLSYLLSELDTANDALQAWYEVNKNLQQQLDTANKALELFDQRGQHMEQQQLKIESLQAELDTAKQQATDWEAEAYRRFPTEDSYLRLTKELMDLRPQLDAAKQENEQAKRAGVRAIDEIVSLQYANSRLQQENERLTKILQTPVITEDDYELVKNRLNQAIKVLEEIQRMSSEWQVYDAVKNAISLLQEEGKGEKPE